MNPADAGLEAALSATRLVRSRHDPLRRSTIC